MSDRGEVMSAVGKPCETDVGVETSAAAAQQPRPDSRAAGGDRSAPRVPSPAEANPETSTEEAPETPSDGVQATDEPTVAAGSPRKSPVGFYGKFHSSTDIGLNPVRRENTTPARPNQPIVRAT